jgi:hypothetical protein
MDYTSLVAAIQDTSSENDDPTFVSNIPVFVNNAEKRIYQIVKIPALRKNATTFVEPNNPYLTLPTDYLAPWEFAVISSGGAYSYLLLKDVSFIREVYPYAASTSVPKYYAQFDENTYLLGPTPSAALQSELHYFYYPESIVSANTTWLGDNFENVLLYGCLVEAAAFLKLEEDIVKQYAEQFSVNLKLLQEYANGKLKSGSYR